MRRCLIIFMLLSCALSRAQESRVISGRIQDADGNPVEYVSLGIPGTGFCTVSSADGHFELTLPAGISDTLEFHHVSYDTVFRFPEDTMLVTMERLEIQPAVSVPFKTVEKALVRKGTRLPSAFGNFSPASIGKEVGSVVKVSREMRVKKIEFSVSHNGIPGAVVCVNIYDIEDGEFVNVLTRPEYIPIPVSSELQEFAVEPDELVCLGPGEYFVALKFVDGDDLICRDWRENSGTWSPEERQKHSREVLEFPLYLKGSYVRNAALSSFEKLPVNIGLTVTGSERR